MGSAIVTVEVSIVQRMEHVKYNWKLGCTKIYGEQKVLCVEAGGNRNDGGNILTGFVWAGVTGCNVTVVQPSVFSNRSMLVVKTKHFLAFYKQSYKYKFIYIKGL